jgi:hypothetical protein
MTVPRVCLEEIAMAKAKKRVAARKKSSKRGKANAKPARKTAAKHATPKKAKSKVQRAGRSTAKSAAKRKKPPKMVETTQVVAMPVEVTPMDVIEQRATGVVAITEYESVQITTSVSPVVEPERGEDIGSASASP